ncbi:LOW QUALITY PROTEIN: uncharacterized protein LOC126792450 [Argentina anserina]|uniref:LOW QUALITY PROTEIN: uncharacterized protein LOC126792450 n=1 Tax=Argentina anserina TaxID=57926 RepID=UPI0021765B85|nr:LOW QUALITY PROTEIN: uncharacterized protein LOC126792450 [Potentilla anserina]
MEIEDKEAKAGVFPSGRYPFSVLSSTMGYRIRAGFFVLIYFLGLSEYHNATQLSIKSTAAKEVVTREEDVRVETELREQVVLREDVPLAGAGCNCLCSNILERIQSFSARIRPFPARFRTYNQVQRYETRKTHRMSSGYSRKSVETVGCISEKTILPLEHKQRFNSLNTDAPRALLSSLLSISKAITTACSLPETLASVDDAMMLWKRLYGNDLWAHHSDQLEGLNEDFSKMLSANAEFKAFIGMGEPLHNIDNVIKAVDIMVDDQGLHFSPRKKITVSTSGLVPQLRRYLRESNCALAVGLNATTDEVRKWIMPINRKYNIGVLLQTLREELRFKNNYRVLFEYVMLAGVNDSIEDARRLADLVQGGNPCKINLITFNPHSGSHFRPTSDEKMVEFRNYLAGAGRVVFMRPSRGDDQMAACGQLGKPGEIQAPILCVPKVQNSDPGGSVII